MELRSGAGIDNAARVPVAAVRKATFSAIQRLGKGFFRVQRPMLLRIDFTLDGGDLSLPAAARSRIDLRSIRPSASPYRKIVALQPDIICFDYDCPDMAGLTLLRQVKKDFPSVPILMLTEHNSEELAIWALRSRVWDYFVKPIDTEAFLRAIQQLHELRKGGGSGTARKIVVPSSSGNRDQERRNATSAAANAAERGVARAKLYVAQHFAEKISAREVAELCNMSQFHFSRSFRRICGQTFSEYLLEVRVRKAIELLSRPRVTVTGACLEVGFRDLSYFGRVFKRYAGMTPSEYRDRHLKTASRTTAAAEKPAGQSGAGEAEPADDATSKLKAELLVHKPRS